MKIIVPISRNILKIWNKQKYSEYLEYRPILYLKSLSIDDGILLYNIMTNEMIIISKEEFNDINNGNLKETNFFLHHFLVTHWFMIPKDQNEKTMVYLHRNITRSNKLVDRHLNNFTILTTTDCNARCYYCFELGAKRISMSKQTAEDVAKFIIHKADPNDFVRISWFGGEPLYNNEVIDIISNRVKDSGLRLASSMISNGYLFDDELVDRAANIWNLKNVQITLDGTEAVYNKTKAYVYKDVNPFEVVLNNIEKLMKSNISVNIRLNLGLKNYKDLYELINTLHDRFIDYKNKFSVYATLLYENLENNLLSYTDEQRRFVLNESIKLNNLCIEKGIAYTNSSKYFRGEGIVCRSCMADSPIAAMITPDGKLGSCEHYVDSDFYGSIYDTSSLDRDYDSIRKWKELRDEKSECNTCFYYPKCFRLKGCVSSFTPNSEEYCIKRYYELERYMYEKYMTVKNKRG